MRAIRECARFCLRNSFARRDADGVQLSEWYFDTLRRSVRRFSPVLSRSLDLPGAVSILRLVSEAICFTPYGHSLRFRVPLILSIAVTNKCSHPCKHCTAALASHNRVLHVNKHSCWWSKVLQSDVPNVMLTGGEPTVNPHLTDLVEDLVAVKKGVFVFSHAEAAVLAPIAREFKRRVTIVLALYGNEQSHDELRGPGSFARFHDSLEAIKKAGGRVAINCVVSEQDVSAAEYLATTKVNSRPDRVYLSKIIAVGRSAARSKQDTNVTDPAALASAIRKNAKCSVAISLQSSGSSTPPLFKYEAMSVLQRAMGITGFRGCSVGQWAMHISTHGTVHICAFSETRHPIGDLSVDSIESVWSRIQAKYIGVDGVCHIESGSFKQPKLYQIGMEDPNETT